MVVQGIPGAVGCRQKFDPESPEQLTRPELGRLQPLDDLIVDLRRRCPIELLFYTEHLARLILEPGTCRRAAEEMPVLGEGLPDFSWICFHVRRAVISRAHSKRFERYP